MRGCIPLKHIFQRFVGLTVPWTRRQLQTTRFELPVATFRWLVATLFVALSNTVSAQTVVNVNATVNDGGDDYAAVQSALSTAIANTPAVLQFGSGTYDFIGLGAGDRIIDLNGVNGLTIKGTSTTTIMIHDLESTFVKSTNGSNLKVQDFTIRRTPWPFSQGNVTSVGSDQVTVGVQSGFPAFTDTQFVDVSGNPVSTDVNGNFTTVGAKRRIKALTKQSYAIKKITLAGVDSYTVKFTAAINNVGVGDGFILRRRTPAHVVHLSRTDTVDIVNIVSAEAPGIIVSGFHAENVTVDNLDTKFFSGQWTSGNADGVNLGSTRGPAIIKNSNMQGLGDDVINLHGDRIPVDSKVSSTVVKVKENQFTVEVGDEVQFFRPSTGEDLGSSVVTNISGSGSVRTLTLQSPITASLVSSDFMFNESRMSNGFQIYNNYFRFGRRNALYLRANGENHPKNVYDNDILDFGGKGINTQSSNFNNSITGYRLVDTIIDQNTFKATSLSSMNTAAMIMITTPKSSGGIAQWKANGGITISNNTFTSYQGSVFLLEALDGASIHDNLMNTTTSGFLRNNNYIFDLQKAVGITLKDNNFSGDSRNHTACFYEQPDPSSVQRQDLGGNSWPVC